MAIFVCFIYYLDISSDPCFVKGRIACLGRKDNFYDSFQRDVILQINTEIFVSGISMHLLVVHFQSWSLDLLVRKCRVICVCVCVFFSSLFIKFYSSTPW